MDFQAKYIIATSWVKYDGLRYSRRSVLASFFPLLASFTAAIRRTSQSRWAPTCVQICG